MNGSVVQKKPRLKKVMKKPRPKNVTREESEIISRSNILKKIVYCLCNGLHRHMLYWTDIEKQEFMIKFVHMGSPEWKEDDIGLFEEIDKLSKKYKEYRQDDKYKQSCRGRFRSNLLKMTDSGYLTFLGETNKKSIILKKYKLNGVLNIKGNIVLSTKKRAKESYFNGFSGCETVQDIPYIKGKLKTENLPNKQSHYLCLSLQNSVTPVGLPGLGTTFNSGNLNEVARNALQVDLSSLYEQMDLNDISFYDTSSANPTMYGSASCSSNEENSSESMEYFEMVGNFDIQNGGVLPTNCIEGPKIDSRNTDSESGREFVVSNCYGEGMKTGNLDGTQNILVEYNRVLESNNSLGGIQFAALPTNCIEGPKIDSRNTDSESGREFVVSNCYGEGMKTGNLDGTQNILIEYNREHESNNSLGGIQFAALPTNSIEGPKIDSRNTDSESGREFVVSNCYGEGMKTGNLDGTQNILVEYNRVLESNNSLGGIQFAALPTNSIEGPKIDSRNTDSESGREFVVYNCYGEGMKTGNLDGTQNLLVECNRVLESNNYLGRIQFAALPTNSIEGPKIDSRNTDSESGREFVVYNCYGEGMKTGNLDGTQNLLVEYNRVLASNNSLGGIQFAALPTNSIEGPKIDSRNTDSESGREFVVSNCYGEGMKTGNLDGTQNILVEYNRILESNNSLGGIQDPLQNWYEDYRSDINNILLQNNDPLWSSANTNCSSAYLSEENHHSISISEDYFSFESMVSNDDGN